MKLFRIFLVLLFLTTSVGVAMAVSFNIQEIKKYDNGTSDIKVNVNEHIIEGNIKSSDISVLRGVVQQLLGEDASSSKPAAFVPLSVDSDCHKKYGYDREAIYSWGKFTDLGCPIYKNWLGVNVVAKKVSWPVFLGGPKCSCGNNSKMCELNNNTICCNCK